jgi:transcriptional regulator with GAF, ATPase, and Fis domain
VLSIGEQSVPPEQSPGDDAAGRPTELKSVEREHILHVLNNTGWVIDGSHGAAAVLGLAPSTLRSRMKRLGIARRAS